MSEWISTGKAAKMLGYTSWHFVRKFKTIIPNKRLARGNYRWLASSVVDLARAD